MREEYVDPNSARVLQPGSAFPGFQSGVGVKHVSAKVEIPEPEDFPEVEEEQEEEQEESASESASDGSSDNESEDTGEQDEEEDDESTSPQDDETEETFDPNQHGVDAVINYVADHPEEQERVLEAEKAGKNRSTLVAALS